MKALLAGVSVVGERAERELLLTFDNMGLDNIAVNLYTRRNHHLTGGQIVQEEQTADASYMSKMDLA